MFWKRKQRTVTVPVAQQPNRPFIECSECNVQYDTDVWSVCPRCLEDFDAARRPGPGGNDESAIASLTKAVDSLLSLSRPITPAAGSADTLAHEIWQRARTLWPVHAADLTVGPAVDGGWTVEHERREVQPNGNVERYRVICARGETLAQLADAVLEIEGKGNPLGAKPFRTLYASAPPEGNEGNEK